MRLLDVSIFLAAWVPSQHIAQALALVEEGAIASADIARHEFTNAVHRLARRSVLSTPRADDTLQRFDRLDLQLVTTGHLVTTALATARRYNQARIYDAIYLATAEELGLELWTCDRRSVNSFGADRPPLLRLCPDDV
jgi:predicted nucleic acid-binding protein